ncbi:MAG: AI-2E family transporter [Patescibacteria group bacterium]|jgi:predicted PurR-regulated permease PerM
MQNVTQHEAVARWFFLGIAAVIIFLSWKIVEPFYIVLLTAVIASVVMTPIEKRLRHLVKRPWLSSLIMVLIMFVMIVGPLATVTVIMAQQAADIIKGTVANSDWVAHFKLAEQPFIMALPGFARDYLLSVNISELLGAFAKWVSEKSLAILSGGATFVLNTSIFFICVYFFLFEREKINVELIKISPFKDTVDRGIMVRMSETVRGVVFGSIIVSIIQGIVAAIGFTIFGVPGALIWAAVVVVASQIPMIGTSSVTIPVVIYLLLIGHIPAAIGMAIWAILAVGLVDNLVSPFIVGSRTKMHSLLILLSILGGIQYFGPIGFILGPTVLAALLVVLELYKAGILERKDVA